jgi:hypothetical protein
MPQSAENAPAPDIALAELGGMYRLSNLRITAYEHPL